MNLKHNLHLITKTISKITNKNKRIYLKRQNSQKVAKEKEKLNSILKIK